MALHTETLSAVEAKLVQIAYGQYQYDQKILDRTLAEALQPVREAHKVPSGTNCDFGTDPHGNLTMTFEVPDVGPADSPS